LVKREKERWAMENQRDECFADMYVHPQETDYNIDTLFELIDASELDYPVHPKILVILILTKEYIFIIHRQSIN
ncbi:MAG: hypothetical protein ACKO9I_17555, partial [Sphaerospermopsis kisseleviana]|nr:hypothetical protein [Sphaerospermopsis kisseleviana CS-549]